jgi:probable phosphoglycerate mutase
LLKFHIDGGSRGNPGPAGYGVVVTDAAGNPVTTLHASLGVQTNNFAEYSGLLAALRYALENGATDIAVYSDSELLVRQMQGRYQVKSPSLRPLFDEASQLARKIPRFRIEHVYRESNRDADRLANQAMDKSSSSRSR